MDHEAVLDAAGALRTAVHDLALASTGGRHDPATLAAAGRLVAEAAAVLDGERLPPWWDGPPSARTGWVCTPIGTVHCSRARSIRSRRRSPGSRSNRSTVRRPSRSRSRCHRSTRAHHRAVHGGYLAALFDELLGGVQGRARDGGGYTGRLTIRYRTLTPVDEPLVFTGWITEDKGRHITATATCRTADDASPPRPKGCSCGPRAHEYVDPAPHGGAAVRPESLQARAPIRPWPPPSISARIRST